MTLSEIKDQIAQQHGWEDWDHLLYVADKHVPFMRQCIEDVMDSAITASIEADRKDCAEKAKVSKLESYEMDKSNVKPTGTYYLREGAAYFVDKSSILDRPYPEMK